MLQAVAEPHAIEQRDLHVTPSIGVSAFSDDGADAETLVKNADAAVPGKRKRRLEQPRMAFELTRRSVICGSMALIAGRAGAAELDRRNPEGLTLAGVNLAGAEFGKIPGTYGTDYMYPDLKTIAYYASLGFNLIRVPFRWERLQPTLGEPFEPLQLELLSAVVEYAAAERLRIVLDTHNYAKRRVAEDDWSTDHNIGSDLVPSAAFQDYCTRLGSAFKDTPAVIFGLMNEPFGLPPEDWLGIANQAIGGMRRAGARQLILVPGVAYTGAHSWISAGNVVMANIVDPENNFALEVHQYFDADSSGTSANAVSSGIGTERIKVFQDWARTNGFKAFLGEFASGSDEVSLVALADICRTLASNSDVWIGWAAWAGGSWWPADYIFNLDPTQDGEMRPQTRILASFARSAAGNEL